MELDGAGNDRLDNLTIIIRGQGNIIFPVQLTTSRIGNLTRLIHTLLYVMTIHTYIHTVLHTYCTVCNFLRKIILLVIVVTENIFISLFGAALQKAPPGTKYKYTSSIVQGPINMMIGQPARIGFDCLVVPFMGTKKK